MSSGKARALSNWERIVTAVHRRDELQYGTGSFGRADSNNLASFVPPSLGQTSNIDAILQVANEIQPENPNVARILCEYAYSLAQDLDPNSEGRGVLQFKTGLLSIIKQRLAKKDGRIDRTQDIAVLVDFYKDYRKKNKIDELQSWRISGASSVDPIELEKQNLKLRKVNATLKVLKDVIDDLTKGTSDLISNEFKEVMESDAAKIEEFKAYNILPLEARGIPDPYLLSAEVRAAVKELEGTFHDSFDESAEGFLHGSFTENAEAPPKDRPADIFDRLEYIFGFQRDNSNNQREHLVLLLANAQSRLERLKGENPKLDESAVNLVCEKILDNYNKWCEYLGLSSRYNSANLTRTIKLLLASLYLLIWGEAANVRFLPECLCYIFHCMAEEVLNILKKPSVERAPSCTDGEGSSFLTKVISPIYSSIAAEAYKGSNGKKPHSSWRNYDDFNEYFWSSSCFQLQWPLQFSNPFFSGVKEADGEVAKQSTKRRRLGKSSFVEHRTYLHLYHSFHRLWIFLVLAFQGLAVVAFSRSLNLTTVKGLLSLGPTFVVMKLVESVLDIMLMYGAYTNAQGKAVARIFLRFFWFGSCSAVLTYIYILVLKENNNNLSSSVLFKFYAGLLCLYLVLHFFVTLLLRVPLFRVWTNKCGGWGVINFIKWMHQEHYYIGRGLYERTQDYLKYLSFWAIVLGCKFTFSYFLQIKPLVDPTRAISDYRDLTYTWHDFVSKGNHNILTIVSLWAPVVMIYLMDIQIWYTIISSIWGVLDGTRERLGEIRSLEMLQNRFKNYPDEFVKKLQPGFTIDVHEGETQQGAFNIDKARANAMRFSPYWNEIIVSLREEDYINNREKELLLMPLNKSDLSLVQWPLFLLVSKIGLAADLAADFQGSQADLWKIINRDEYMGYAVVEVFESFANILSKVLTGGAKRWADNLKKQVYDSLHRDTFMNDFQLRKLPDVKKKISALLGLLGQEKSAEQEKGAIKAMLEFYDVVTHDVLSPDLRLVHTVALHQPLQRYEEEGLYSEAHKDVHFFNSVNWLASPEDRAQVKRLNQLLTINYSAANVPTNLEACRRLQFFANSLFMNMPKPKPVRAMRPFSVFTPYYSESVMYTIDELQKSNEDGISTLFYLQKIFPDEWKNFLERVGCKDEFELERKSRLKGAMETLELRLWASYRGQTLARTVRGMMYYRRALLLQSFLESTEEFGTKEDSKAYQLSRAARGQVDLKFTYVVTCQIYGQQKAKQDHRAADILFLMQRNEALRIAFIDTVEVLKDKKVHKEYFSKLVKADVNGKDQEIYKIKLPGDPKLGEGKPENQNHAIIFTRGEAVQTIDMNQDNYFEEALKLRNLLEEFGEKHGLRHPSILGVREHVFTGSVSSLAWFMSNQEGSFVTLGQRVLANPLKVRMHYGHPDVFDRIFHITRGGISKASRVINISEDIYAGFNSTLRQGNITHHEYIQVFLKFMNVAP